MKFNFCLHITAIVLSLCYHAAMLIWLFVYPTCYNYIGTKDMTMRLTYALAAIHSYLFFMNMAKLFISRRRCCFVTFQCITFISQLALACVHVAVASIELRYYGVFACAAYVSAIWIGLTVMFPLSKEGCKCGGCKPGCFKKCCACKCGDCYTGEETPRKVELLK